MTVRAWRRAREISQTEMASRLDVHVNTYQNWENEPEKITIANAMKIAQILGIELNDIDFVTEEH